MREAGVVVDSGVDLGQPSTDLGPPAPSSGTFSLLTYNVAGLPAGLSNVDPERTLPLVSPLLNSHDLVLVQEDFGFPELTRASANHPHISEPSSPPWEGKLIGDGLNRFSRFPLGALTREAWRECNGMADAASDCLAAKGLSVSTVELAAGAVIDVYNLHMDAGGSDADQAARVAQVEQLRAMIAARQAERPVIVAGDFNLKSDSSAADKALLELLLANEGLIDACRAVACGDERLDRVLLRDGGAISLEVLEWQLDQRFVDDQGKPLSDHLAVATRLRWTRAVAP